MRKWNSFFFSSKPNVNIWFEFVFSSIRDIPLRKRKIKTRFNPFFPLSVKHNLTFSEKSQDPDLLEAEKRKWWCGNYSFFGVDKKKWGKLHWQNWSKLRNIINVRWFMPSLNSWLNRPKWVSNEGISTATLVNTNQDGRTDGRILLPFL